MLCTPFTVEEIHELVASVGYTAGLAKTAGADAVELHAYGGYLIDQFQSEMWNFRTDEYGGDFKRRMRFTMELIAEIQKNCGKDFPLIVKFTPDHCSETPGSRKLAEGIEMAKMFEEAGVAALHIDKGCYDVWWEVIPNVYVEDANQAALAKEIKKVVKIPVMTHGKLGDPDVAERVLQEGCADFIGLGHTSICEPHWFYKVKKGLRYDLRPCIGCNECLNRIAVGLDDSCAINPLSGVEKEYPLTPMKEKKRILVIGGGPAGMQTAITARERGIEVDLWDQSNELGGTLLAAGAPSFKKDVMKYVKYITNKVYRSGINVRLKKAAFIDEIEKGNYDFVIVAAGSRPLVPPIKGIDKPIVKTSTDILTGKEKPGQRSIVIGGGLVGCETALSIVKDYGKEADIIEILDDILKVADHSLNNDMKLRDMLAHTKIKTICGAKVTAVLDDGIAYTKDGKEEKLRYDTVVLACGYSSNNEIAGELEKRGMEFKVIGDSMRPRKIYNAVHEGYHAARLLFEEVLG
jgi:2-enoate reductase